jgi:hypothetical protein
VLCGGRERSVEEYAPLAAAAGLAAADVRTTPSDQLIITYRPSALPHAPGG